MPGYSSRRAANDGGGPDLAGATGLMGADTKQKVERKKAKKSPKRPAKKSRKQGFEKSPSKSALEQALSGFDTPSDFDGKKTPDMMAKEAIMAAEEFMRCNSVPEGLVTAKDGLAGALPALATRHAEIRQQQLDASPGKHPAQGGVEWEHSVAGKDTPGGFAAYDSFGLELPETPADELPDAGFRQELVRASDKSATKKMRKAKSTYDEKVVKARGDVSVSPSRHSLSPLRADPAAMARQVAASAKAAASAHPWRGNTPEQDGWTKMAYVPHADEVRYKTPPEKVHKVAPTQIPVEFQVRVDDPIFPSLEVISFKK